MVIVALIGALVALTGGCSDAGNRPRGTGPDGADGRPGVIATTTIWADIVSGLTCGELKVTSLIPAGVDTHSFEPTVRDAERLRSADLVVANGLGLENDMKDLLEAARGDGSEVIEVADHVNRMGRDPHVWLDPDRVAEAIPTIEKSLEPLLGEGGEEMSVAELRRCADEYVDQLHDLSASMDRILAVIPPGSRKLVTNHESLGYFADRFDFRVLGALIPSTSTLGESDPRTLDELAREMESTGVRAVFADTTSAHKLADSLTEQLGESVRVVQLFTESLGDAQEAADTYLKMMTVNAHRVADALSR